jgi:hypothetical protein
MHAPRAIVILLILLIFNVFLFLFAVVVVVIVDLGGKGRSWFFTRCASPRQRRCSAPTLSSDSASLERAALTVAVESEACDGTMTGDPTGSA